MMIDLATGIGWAGAVVLLTCYAAATNGRMRPTGSLYLTLNVAASVGLGVNTAVMHAWPSFVVNVLWLLIGLRSLVHPAAPIARTAGPADAEAGGRD